MLMRGWLQALCAVVCVLAFTGCGKECVDQYDCRSKKGAAPVGKEYICNDENTCELKDKTPPSETTCSPDCASGEFCDTSSGTGVCRVCSETQGCTAPLFCDATANSGKGICIACADTATGNGTDQGCSVTAPVCDTSAGNGAGACKACVDSATGNDTDLGCSATAPVCDTSGGNSAGVCKACVDSATDNGTDLGCSATAPICNTSAASGAGACTVCSDTATGNGTDLGCSDAAPVCDTSAANGAGVCKACSDTATGNGTDQGCSATAPICNTSAANGAGVCATCLDSATGNGTDLGCSATTPLCDSSANSGAGACKACVDSATGNGTDSGCTATSPICDPTAASGAGACRVCLNDASGSATDLGCAAPTAFCDATAASGLGACRVCVTGTNDGCSGSQTCNASGTACEGCATDAECNASTPICRPPPPVSACVECTTDAHCTAARPSCDTATNLCGCTNDDACSDAPGNQDYCNTAANGGRGECRECLTDAQCASADPSKPFCDNQTTCVQCFADSDCPLSQVCSASKSCVAAPGADPATTSGQIQAFIDAPVGTLSPALTIENAFVTYIKPTVGDPAAGDTQGFFLQAEYNGPAMFVDADPSTLQVGDRITLTVGEKFEYTSGKVQAARNISGLTISARGYPVQNLHDATPAGLAVDVSAATDLVTGVEGYFGKILHITGTMTGTVASSGAGHSAVSFTTTGLSTVPLPKLRFPATFATQYDLVGTCTFTLDVGPMWKFTNTANPPVTTSEPEAYDRSDFSTLSCPAPKPVSAAASSLTQVVVTFDRAIDPATVLSTGEQFTFDNGLTATNAQLNGKQVTLTTSTQTAGTNYTVTVATSIKDLLGTPVSATANTATFKGYRESAVLRITEVQPNAAGSADLVELLAVSAGTVEGFVLQQDVNSAVILATFPSTTVAEGDIIVVHMSPATGYASETTAKNQFPAASTAVNYDTAWDFAGNAANITYSSRVLLVKDAVGTIQDAIPFISTSGTPPGGFPANLQAIQAAGQWLPPDCGGALCTTSSTPTAAGVSADWTGLKTNATKTDPTVRRVSATDTNTKDDWAVGAQSWGLPNP